MNTRLLSFLAVYDSLAEKACKHIYTQICDTLISDWLEYLIHIHSNRRVSHIISNCSLTSEDYRQAEGQYAWCWKDSTLGMKSSILEPKVSTAIGKHPFNFVGESHKSVELLLQRGNTWYRSVNALSDALSWNRTAKCGIFIATLRGRPSLVFFLAFQKVNFFNCSFVRRSRNCHNTFASLKVFTFLLLGIQEAWTSAWGRRSVKPWRRRNQNHPMRRKFFKDKNSLSCQIS